MIPDAQALPALAASPPQTARPDPARVSASPAAGRAALRVTRHRSIHEIEAATWDSINGPSDLFHSHRFIRTVEEARVENGDFWYLMFHRCEALVATAALSAFGVSLDLFVGGRAARFIERVRRRRTGFMRIRVLFCGLPVSLGQTNLVVADAIDAAEVVRLLVREMSAICRDHGIRHMCVKELPATRLCAVRGIERHGFFRADSLPYVTMPLPWSSFDAYLASLRHGYRRPIRLSLRRLGWAAPVITRSARNGSNGRGGPQAEAGRNGSRAEAEEDAGHVARRPPQTPGTVATDAPRLVLGGPEVCPPDRLHALYMNVMARARVKLETLDRPFFERLCANLGGDLEVLALVQGGDILGCALLASAGRTMTFMLVGLDYDRRDEHDVYFNLLYGIIALAIERACSELHLGQTSYWLKQRVGGSCVPEYMYFRSNIRVVHAGLRMLRSRVFPPTQVAEPRVFRSEPGCQSESSRIRP